MPAAGGEAGMSAPVPITRQRGWRLAMKMALDRSAAAIGLLVTSPLQFLVALTVLISIGWPVLFRQERPGRWGRPIRVLKFRTMNESRGSDGRLLADEHRITAMGRLLRATSLDELPQLWNVLRGELSLVGPRPLLCQYLERYSPEQARRHDVLPGITGWSQVNGRNALSWDEKLALDVWYVDNWSLGLDARILALTAVRVLDRRGVSQEGHVTMPEFMGSQATHYDRPDSAGGRHG
jgi:lipopolysaccharide/colanic/teichoic acid biosynthesis glycosyltransferase